MSQDKTEKKRKRSAENGVRPSKKAVLDTPSQVIKVSILQDTGDWAPVIGKSSNPAKAVEFWPFASSQIQHLYIV